MKSFRDYKPSVQCNECDTYLLIGDNPNNPILEICEDCIQEKEMFENMTTKERLEEVVMWVIEDLWEELSKKSKTRVIRQLKFMGYPTEDLEEIKDDNTR
jgi:hypothetical protein